MYKLKLSSDLAGCPACWQNWIHEFNEQWSSGNYPTSDPFFTDIGQELSHFNSAGRALAEWGARLEGDSWDLCSAVVFASEQAALLFIMRYAS